MIADDGGPLITGLATGRVTSSLGALGRTAAWEDKDTIQDSSTGKGMSGGGK